MKGRRYNQHRPRVDASVIQPNWDTKTESFDLMNLSENLLRGIYGYGFQKPSEIQSLAIQPISEGRSVIAQAQSGTGKTGAFTIGIVNVIDIGSATTQALIMAPTRELATQISDVFKEISKHISGCSVELFIGGNNPMQEDIEKAKRNPKLIIGTPGRMKALVEQGFIRCEYLKLVCLDEADQMLDENFLEDIKEIFSYMPQGIQVLLFSATFPPEVVQLSNSFMTDPVRIFVKNDELTLEGISQFFVDVQTSQNKLECLLDLYEKIHVQKAVIFVNQKQTVEYLRDQLNQRDFTVLSIHGAMEQRDRNLAMSQFRLGAARILIATDLIGRGIDIQQITLVINFELPKSTEQYLHRIGRSGRYGRKGVAINICDSYEVRQLERITEHYHTNIEVLPVDFSDRLNSIQEEEY